MRSSLVAAAFVAALANATNDAHRSFVEMAMENGYASEMHSVVTIDGYVSQLYRLPGKAGDKTTGKPVVLMMAGLECDMNFWTINDPSVTPAYVLVEQGFDVWLANNRGTRYGTAHVSLSTDSKEYWNFNQEQMGLYDLPANIDFVLNATGKEQLTYIGHSQGTTQMLLGAALVPEYFKEKVNLFVALAPVANLKHVQVPFFHRLSKYWRELQFLAVKEGAFNLFNANWWEEEANLIICNEFEGFCEGILKYGADANLDVDNLERFNVFLKDFPAGSGYQSIVTYGQNIQTDTWRRFNYGERENIKKYGTIEPPEVPVHDISIPTALVSGSLDNLADPEDVAELVAVFPKEWLVFNEQYELGHMSFSLAKDMSWFTGPVVDLIKEYNVQTSPEAFLQ